MNNDQFEPFVITLLIFVFVIPINAFMVPSAYSQSIEGGTGDNTTGQSSPDNFPTGTKVGNSPTGSEGSNSPTGPEGSNSPTGPEGSNSPTGPEGSNSPTGSEGSHGPITTDSGSSNDGRTTLHDTNNDGRTTLHDTNNDGRTTVHDSSNFGVTSSHTNNLVNKKNQENTQFKTAFASNQTSLQKVSTKNIVLHIPKLSTGEMTQISSLDPFHIIGVQVSMNLTNNRTQLVAAQLTERGMEHAVVINLTKVNTMGNGDSVYRANFGSSLSGINPFNAQPDIVDPITSLLIRNNDIRDIEFKNASLGNITLVTDNLS